MWKIIKKHINAKLVTKLNYWRQRNVNSNSIKWIKITKRVSIREGKWILRSKRRIWTDLLRKKEIDKSTWVRYQRNEGDQPG